MRKILSRVLLGILVLILVWVCYEKYIRKDAVVKLGKYGILVVLTESMEPEIKQKELIVIKQMDKYKVDDVVTFLDWSDTLITHRIRQIDEYGFIARGDNNEVVDENSGIERIQGKVIFHSFFLGIFALYGLKVLILLWLIFILVVWRRQRRKKKREEKSEDETS